MFGILPQPMIWRKHLHIKNTLLCVTRHLESATTLCRATLRGLRLLVGGGDEKLKMLQYIDNSIE
jgi:hypothetical protein